MYKESIKLGNNIRKLRIKKGISQIEIAEYLGVSKGFISNIENGKSNPTLLTISKLSSAIGVSSDKLLK